MHAHHHLNQTNHLRNQDDDKDDDVFNPTKSKSISHRKPDRFVMEVECMRAVMKKLTIFYTPNFKPINTHDELDRVMATHGFIPQPPVTAGAVVWKEYSFPAAGMLVLKSATPLPRPTLPYPRIDGLHVDTYRDFLESVNFYLRRNNISDLFHIRGIPLYHAYDRSHKWIRLRKDEMVYVYREGMYEKDSNAVPNKDQKTVMRIVPLNNIMDRR